MTTRKAAVAGKFYPQNPAELDGLVSQLLAKAEPREFYAKAIISPHAGYIYSGEVAASAYRSLEAHKRDIHRVLLLGPSHHVSFVGLALPNHDRFETPLGSVQVDTQACEQLLALDFVEVHPSAHTWEHSLEVQLPFVQKCFSQVSIVPLVVGDASPEMVAQAIGLFWDDPHTLTVISSDLSHFHSYQEAQALDSETSRRIENKDYHLQGQQACGCKPLNGLMKLIEADGHLVTRLALINSGDSAGDKHQVVGYGAYVIH